MAGGVWTPEFTYITGVVRFHDLAYMVTVFDEMAKQKVEHSFVTEWDAGTWRKGDDDDQLKWSIIKGTVVLKPKHQGVFLGVGGEIMCLGSGDTHYEQIEDVSGHMRGIGAIDDEAYACGMNLQVYHRKGANKWVAIDKGMRLAKSKEVRGFECIGGFSKKEIYASGWNGEIWQYHGKKWEQNDSPTKLIMTALCCGEDENVYIAGQSGTLLRGRNGEWEILKQSMKEDIWSLAWFDGDLYASTMRGVYKLQDDKLKEVKFGKDEPETFYHLSAADGVLWSIGPKDVMSFDGKKWSRID